ncbi:MAG: leucine-rich repeat domain-containing protein, partial [Candidatus Poribacteria bacterium]|nr:leucine-rich repeat domain-containing protein [Candidatus Poribacteria bacterium]
SELSTFSSLTQLTQLDLQENQIVDISDLGNLTSLNELYLRYNRIVDISPLANIPQIGRIGLAHNQIVDVSPLASLAQLYRLGLRDNRINDATPLINLVNLDRMGLQENPLDNISITHVIPELQNQGAYIPYSSNWSGTALQLKSAFLEQLIRTQASVPLPQTYNNSMSHVLTRDNTTIIATLNLADSSVTDLSGLDGLSNLTSVDISGLQLSSEAINSQIPALEAKGVQFTKQFDWRASLTVQASDSSALNPQTVFFGVAETATDGLNDGLDVPAPPISPTTENTGVSLDCRFVSPNTTDPDLLTDFHNSSNDPYSYVLKIRADDGDVALNWDISAIPSRFNAVKLKQIETDNPPPVIDLRTSTSSVLALEAGVYHTFELFISGSVTVSLSQGWNMFSIPGEPLVTDPADLFGSDSGVILPLYRWNPEQFTYQAANELKAGDGYWLLTLEENMQVEIPYQAIDSYQKDLAPGWNMIGSTTLPADFTDPQEDPDKAILQYSLFGWNAAAFTYQLANQIEPGKGYWVLALSACQLTITGGTTATAPAALKSPEITIPIRINSETQSYQLTLGLDASASTGLDVYDQLSPPALPSAENSIAEFEVAGGGYRLCQDVRPMRAGTSWQLRLNLPTPSKLEIDTASLPNDFELVVVDSQAGHNLDVGIRRQLTAGQHQVKLELRSKIDLPKVTRVWQNYPNPFNPETWIPFQLHQPSTVGLQIYDVKGQLIRSLDLGQVAAGTYTDTATAIYWDGKTEMGETVASGTYFYTLTTDNYTQTRKMIILK